MRGHPASGLKNQEYLRMTARIVPKIDGIGASADGRVFKGGREWESPD
jgi:hypothetical protein